MVECALAGADVSTIPDKTIAQLLKHPLTDAGQAKFMADWEKMKQKACGGSGRSRWRDVGDVLSDHHRAARPYAREDHHAAVK